MTKEEMKEYLVSTGLYKNTRCDLYYQERMMDTDKTVPISDLVERFIDVDKEFNGEQWNLRQILSNIDIIIPMEDREKV